MKHTASLDRLRIATPCPISWEQITGDNRVRFCHHCQAEPSLIDTPSGTTIFTEKMIQRLPHQK